MSYPPIVLDDGRRVTLTRHAAERLVEMGIGSPHVRNMLQHPDEVFESPKYPGTFTYRRGEHSIAVDESSGRLVVITALYSCVSAWRRADKQHRLPPDRDLRTDTGIPE